MRTWLSPTQSHPNPASGPARVVPAKQHASKPRRVELVAPEIDEEWQKHAGRREGGRLRERAEADYHQPTDVQPVWPLRSSSLCCPIAVAIADEIFISRCTQCAYISGPAAIVALHTSHRSLAETPLACLRRWSSELWGVPVTVVRAMSSCGKHMLSHSVLFGQRGDIFSFLSLSFVDTFPTSSERIQNVLASSSLLS